MSSLNANMFIYPAQKGQIDLSMAGKFTVLKEYLDYTDVFLKKSATELLKRSDINKHLINLEPG